MANFQHSLITFTISVFALSYEILKFSSSLSLTVFDKLFRKIKFTVSIGIIIQKILIKINLILMGISSILLKIRNLNLTKPRLFSLNRIFSNIYAN